MNKVLESFAKPLIELWEIITDVEFWSDFAEFLGVLTGFFLVVGGIILIILGSIWFLKTVQKIIKEIQKHE